MDAVRFGRALGFGARQAAKTVVSAVDAARAQNPSPPAHATNSPAARATSPASPAASATAHTASVVVLNPRPVDASQPRATLSGETVNRANQTAARSISQARGVKEGLSRFRDSAVEPVVRLSGVLWLELTGVFFGIFALSTAVAIWRLRADWRAAIAHPTTHGGLIAAVAVFVLFTYFCITSFIRARRRQNRRS